MRFVITVIFMLCVQASWADEIDPSFPALFAVSGVATDDMLNVRAAPNGSTDIIGTLAHNARDIEVLALSREGRWAQINVGETSGWVALRFLNEQPQVLSQIGLPVDLQCFGTEPFWSMTFGDTAQFSIKTPAGQSNHAMTSLAPSLGTIDLANVGFRFQWMDQAQSVTAHILPGQCYDGMSDRRYGLHYIDDRGPRVGCCRLN